MAGVTGEQSSVRICVLNHREWKLELFAILFINLSAVAFDITNVNALIRSWIFNDLELLQYISLTFEHDTNSTAF